MAKAISDGGEKLMKYLNSGAVKELRDVIPHYDDNNADTFLGDSDPDDNDQVSLLIKMFCNYNLSIALLCISNRTHIDVLKCFY